MDKLPQHNRVFIYFIPVMTSISCIVVGFFLVYFSMLTQFINDLNIGSSKQYIQQYTNTMVSLLPLGACIGSYYYPEYIKKYGENRGMIYMNILAIFSMALQILSFSTPFIFISRILMGIYCAITISIIPSYSLSIAPHSISGVSGSSNQFAIIAGMAFAYLLSDVLTMKSVSASIRLTIYLGLPLINNVVHILVMILLKFDNISTLIEAKNDTQIIKYLKFMFGREWKKFESDMRKYKTKPIQIQQPQIINHNLFSRFIKRHKANILAVTLAIISQCCGYDYILIRAKYYVTQMANYETTLIIHSTMMVWLFQILVCGVGISLTRIRGRRYLMIVGVSLVVLSLFVCGLAHTLYSYNTITFVFFYVFFIGYGISIGPICIMYAHQIMANMRVFLFVYWGLKFCIVLNVDKLQEWLGEGKLYMIFGLICFVCLIILVFRMIETRNLPKKYIPKVLDQFTLGYKVDQSYINNNLDVNALQQYETIEDKVQSNTVI